MKNNIEKIFSVEELAEMQIVSLLMGILYTTHKKDDRYIAKYGFDLTGYTKEMVEFYSNKYISERYSKEDNQRGDTNLVNFDFEFNSKSGKLDLFVRFKHLIDGVDLEGYLKDTYNLEDGEVTIIEHMGHTSGCIGCIAYKDIPKDFITSIFIWLGMSIIKFLNWDSIYDWYTIDLNHNQFRELPSIFIAYNKKCKGKVVYNSKTKTDVYTLFVEDEETLDKVCAKIKDVWFLEKRIIVKPVSDKRLKHKYSIVLDMESVEYFALKYLHENDYV